MLSAFFFSCSAAHRDLPSFPTRRSSDLGLHTGHTWIRGNGEIALRPEDVTIAEVLKPAGYRSAVIGKWGDRKSTRLNSSHVEISYAVFCLKKKKRQTTTKASHERRDARI